jgi:hypothetical protein
MPTPFLISNPDRFEDSADAAHFFLNLWSLAIVHINKATVKFTLPTPGKTNLTNYGNYNSITRSQHHMLASSLATMSTTKTAAASVCWASLAL